jgi:hypothetical protein
METDPQNLDRILAEDPMFAMVAEMASGPGDLYVCGGYLLEALTGRERGGLLVASREDPLGTGMLLAEMAGMTPVVFDDGGVHLYGAGWRDVTMVPMTDPDIEGHLVRSGFTAEAIAVDAWEGTLQGLIDPLGGLSDIEGGWLRAASPGVFEEDPARLLHAAELSAEYGLEPDSETERLMSDSANLAAEIEPHRAWRKLSRLFGGRALARKAGLLMRTGVFKTLLPEVDALFGIPQNYYHHLGVWEHTLETMNNLEYMIDSPAAFFPIYSGRRILLHLGREVEGGVKRRAYLGFAALIHDIGKPVAMTVEPSGRIRFQGHQVAGGEMAHSVAARLGLGRKGSSHLAGLVADHMRLGFLMKQGESARTRLEAVREMGDRSIEVIMLSLSDRMATMGEASTEDAVGRYKRMATRVLADYFWDLDYPPLVGGHDVMMHARVGPGPEVGRALFKARVAQREAIVSTRQQALEYLAPDFKGRMNL